MRAARRAARRALPVALPVALAVAAALAAGAAGDPASAQEPRMEGLQTSLSGTLEDPALEARATALASELRCPVCQGLSIEDSPSTLARDMKDLIRAQVAAGASDQEVREYFISKYGEWVLLEPRPAGFNLLVYLLPALALLGGVALIVVAVRRWTLAEGVLAEETVGERGRGEAGSAADVPTDARDRETPVAP